MSKQTIPVPDIGTEKAVDVIEIPVAVGDTIKPEDTLIVLESDKASMEIPAPCAGKIIEIKVKVGDKIKTGHPILVVEASAAASTTKTEQPNKNAPASDKPAAQEKPAEKNAESGALPKATIALETIVVPDIGGSANVDVIEVNVKVGTPLAEGDTMVVLESDKASMEVPAPKAGIVRALKIKEGDKVSAGSVILELETSDIKTNAASSPTATKSNEKSQAPTIPSATTISTSVSEPVAKRESTPVATQPSATSNTINDTSAKTSAANGEIYAGPAVRKYARELGIDLSKVKGTGPKNRIQREDLKAFIKSLIENRGGSITGSGIPQIPEIDFAKFGEIEVQPLTKLNKLTATNMHRSWLNLPHVTQLDEADITELEEFRASLKAEAEKRGVKVTPLPFLLKACAIALKAHPKFNASLLNDGEHIIFKKYVHIGMAVDTPSGLVVPVVRDVDRKSVWDLAAAIAELSQKAKDRKLKPDEMQGGCFTISSLGNIGGNGFTPIINAPEVAILGVSKLSVKPQWNGKEFVPRKMLPLSLSYDHRVVNGADAGRFFTFLTELLADIRRLVL